MTKQNVEEEVDVKLDDVDDSLIDKVQASLDAINGEDVEKDNTDDQQTDDDDSTPDGDQADDDGSTSDDKPDEDEVKNTDETGGTEDSKNEKDTKEVQLPDAYYRAAIHQGWKPDEIKEFFEANPELAIKTLAKNYESTNKLNSEFARMGRIKPDNKVADSKTATEDIAATSVDLDAIKEQYGDDSAIVKAMTIMQAKLDSIPEQQVIERVNNIPHDDPMRATVDKFFVDSALKPYEDFYGEGNDTEKLTQGQYKHRYDMLQMAEDIIVGSQAHGRNITAEAAMEAAHLLVSEPVREAAVRKELTATVRKRAKSVTLKPTKSKAAKTVTDGKLTQKQMIAKVEAGLKKVYR